MKCCYPGCFGVPGNVGERQRRSGAVRERPRPSCPRQPPGDGNLMHGGRLGNRTAVGDVVRQLCELLRGDAHLVHDDLERTAHRGRARGEVEGADNPARAVAPKAVGVLRPRPAVSPPCCAPDAVRLRPRRRSPGLPRPPTGSPCPRKRCARLSAVRARCPARGSTEPERGGGPAPPCHPHLGRGGVVSRAPRRPLGQ